MVKVAKWVRKAYAKNATGKIAKENNGTCRSEAVAKLIKMAEVAIIAENSAE